jgi:hypothetical protein
VFAASCAVGAVFVVIGLSANIYNGNFFKRFDQRTVDFLAEAQQQGETYTWKNKNALRMQNFPRNGRRNVLVIGDSNSGDLLNALILGHEEQFNFSSITIKVGCGNLYLSRSRYDQESTVRPTNECSGSDGYYGAETDLIRRADFVFLASSWRYFEAKLFKESWENLIQSFGEKFYVFGAKNIELTPRRIYESNFEDLFDIQFEQNVEKRVFNSLLKITVGQRFIDPAIVFCKNDVCPLFEDEKLLFYDGSHTTEYGVVKLSDWLLDWMIKEGIIQNL